MQEMEVYIAVRDRKDEFTGNIFLSFRYIKYIQVDIKIIC